MQLAQAGVCLHMPRTLTPNKRGSAHLATAAGRANARARWLDAEIARAERGDPRPTRYDPHRLPLGFLRQQRVDLHNAAEKAAQMLEVVLDGEDGQQARAVFFARADNHN